MRRCNEARRRGSRIDLRAREEATEPSRSIVLQAPAGSGKTTVLTAALFEAARKRR